MEARAKKVLSRQLGSGADAGRVTVLAAGTLLVVAALFGPLPARSAPRAESAAAAVGGGPTVTKITAPRGPATGGSAVKVTGTGLDRASVVRFGGVAAPSFRIESGSQVVALDVIAPPHTAGTVPVTVTTPSGTSPGSPAAMFTYQPARGHWSAVAAQRRFSHTATLLRDGRVLVAGGCIQPDPNGRCSKATAAAEIYDPARRSWSATAPMTMPRIGQLATVLADGKVLVSGGCATLGCSSQNNPAADFSTEISAEIYDPSSRRWTPTRNMLFIHNHPTAALLPAGPPSHCAPNCGKVLVVGIAVTLAGGRAAPASTDAEIYDPRSGTWAATAPTGQSREKPSSVVLHTGKVLVAGAVSDTSAVEGADLFDPATATWSPTGNGEPFPNPAETLTAMADGRVLAAAADPDGVRKGEELYDPTAAPDPANPAVKGGRWTVSAPLVDQRLGNTATLLHDGTVLVTGGNPSPPLATAEVYNDKTASWAFAATMAGGRGQDPFNCGCNAFSATVLHDGTVLVVGASYRTPSLDTYFEANTNFRPISPAAYGPSAELYTPADTHTGHNPLAIAVVVAATAVLAALVVIVVVRRTRRRTT